MLPGMTINPTMWCTRGCVARLFRTARRRGNCWWWRCQPLVTGGGSPARSSGGGERRTARWRSRERERKRRGPGEPGAHHEANCAVGESRRGPTATTRTRRSSSEMKKTMTIPSDAGRAAPIPWTGRRRGARRSSLPTPIRSGRSRTTARSGSPVLGFRPLELGFAGERERLEWGKVRSKEREESVTTLLSSPGRAARAGKAAMARSDRSGRYSAR